MADAVKVSAIMLFVILVIAAGPGGVLIAAMVAACAAMEQA